MESLVRKLVQEEVIKALKRKKEESDDHSQPPKKEKTAEQSSTEDDDVVVITGEKSSNKKSTTKKNVEKTATRLNKLLTKITKKGSTSSSKKTKGGRAMKIQVRWQREDVDGNVNTVKQTEGGGPRFASFDGEEYPTFNELKVLCIDYFFPEGSNYFGEKPVDVIIKLVDSSGGELDLSKSISTYMEKLGLTPSRTYFVISTSPVKYAEKVKGEFERDIRSDDEGSSSDDQLQPVDVSQRKICTGCGKTYTYMCIWCEQDEEYKEGLAIDQQRETADENQEENEIRPDVNVLRQLRIDALARSLTQNIDTKSEISNTPLQDDIKALSEIFLRNNYENFVTFNVRRKHVYSDTMKKMKIFFADGSFDKRFKVEFISVGAKESGVDTGGPGRELVTLFYNLVNGQLLYGEPKNQVFVHDLLKVGSGDFFAFGQLVALSLLHGYDPPRQFCKGLIGYISGSPICFCSIDDIPDIEVRDKLMEIKECADADSFNTCVNSFIERYDFGYNKFKPTFEEKEELTKTIAHHFIISSRLEEIQSFQKGLSCGGVLEIIQKYPNEGIELFSYKSLSSEELKLLFMPERSVENKDMEEVEEDIMYNLHNFIDEVGFGRVRQIKSFDLINVEDGIVDNEEMLERKFTLEDLSVFLTGSRFPSSKVKVLFNHDQSFSGRVTVSTCQLQMVFPVTERYTDGNNFSKNLLEDIINSPGFGNV